MQSVPLGVAAPPAGSPLLGAYNLWSSAQYAACIAELERLADGLHGELATEAAVLAARVYLRLERPEEALRKLGGLGSLGDVDFRCTVEAMRGLALVSLGQGAVGMATIRDASALGLQYNARLAVRMEAVFHKAVGHWTLGEFDEAHTSARIVAAAGVDILSARALALMGWIAVGKLDYDGSLQLFRDAWRVYRSCAGRDVHFEASVVHAIATYDSQLLECGSGPRYYGADLPNVGKAIDTYRLLVGVVDSWRAMLAGDEAKALELAASTEALDVADHWRLFGMASRAGVLQGLGYRTLAEAVSSAAFGAALSLDWDSPPGESRLALLYLAERLAPFNLERARTCLAIFARISSRSDSRYIEGHHPLHDGLRSHSRGLVAAAAEDPAACKDLDEAAQVFERLGFRWRAAGVRLLLGRVSRCRSSAEYKAAHTLITGSFPRSHLAREIEDFVPLSQIGSTVRLSPAQMTIVRALCVARSPRDIAKDRGTTVGTVRNQLKEIYRRTGLHSIQAVVSAFCPIIGDARPARWSRKAEP